MKATRHGGDDQRTVRVTVRLAQGRCEEGTLCEGCLMGEEVGWREEDLGAMLAGAAAAGGLTNQGYEKVARRETTARLRGIDEIKPQNRVSFCDVRRMGGPAPQDFSDC